MPVQRRPGRAPGQRRVSGRAEQWGALRAPFPADQIEYLPQPLRRSDDDRGRCAAGTRYCADQRPCGGRHVRSIHLPYVGHAGITMRLNDVDPEWTLAPMATDGHGLPLFSDGGLWVVLTVLGVSRIGFGDAGGKAGPNAIKETIGDALRNAAMRFGVATYLWSKSPAAQVLAAGGDADATRDPARDWRAEARAAATADAARALWREAAAAGALDDRLRETIEARVEALTVDRATGEIVDAETVEDPSA